jgi:hypothetical protein
VADYDSPAQFRIICGSQYQVAQYIKHPGYDSNSDAVDYDMMLFKVDHAWEFTDYVKPACLPKRNDYPSSGQLCKVSGWGSTQAKDATSFFFAQLELAEAVQSAYVPITEMGVCAAGYKSITRRQFCAGFVEGGRDACQVIICDLMPWMANQPAFATNLVKMRFRVILADLWHVLSATAGFTSLLASFRMELGAVPPRFRASTPALSPSSTGYSTTSVRTQLLRNPEFFSHSRGRNRSSNSLPEGQNCRSRIRRHQISQFRRAISLRFQPGMFLDHQVKTPLRRTPSKMI